jgi:hypothetical protein
MGTAHRQRGEGDASEDGHPLESALMFRTAWCRRTGRDDLPAGVLDLVYSACWAGKGLSRAGHTSRPYDLNTWEAAVALSDRSSVRPLCAKAAGGADLVQGTGAAPAILRAAAHLEHEAARDSAAWRAFSEAASLFRDLGGTSVIPFPGVPRDWQALKRQGCDQERA